MNVVTQTSSSGFAGYRRIATYDKDLFCRFALGHIWNPNKPVILYCGANPSTASHLKDDPTVRFFIDNAMHLGYGGFWVVNPIPYRSSKPLQAIQWLADAAYVEQYMDQNIVEIGYAAIKSKQCVICWGDILPDSCAQQKEEALEAILLHGGHKADNLRCFGFNANGSPRHPAAYGRSRVDPHAPLIPFRR